VLDLLPVVSEGGPCGPRHERAIRVRRFTAISVLSGLPFCGYGPFANEKGPEVPCLSSPCKALRPVAASGLRRAVTSSCRALNRVKINSLRWKGVRGRPVESGHEQSGALRERGR